MLSKEVETAIRNVIQLKKVPITSTKGTSLRRRESTEQKRN